MSVPGAVAAAWGWQPSAIEPLPGGLINATHVVRDGGEPIAVLQRLHPIFGAEVNLDIDAVTAHLAAQGLETPRIIRARDGRAWTCDEGRVWRALTWVDGESVHAVPGLEWAEAGGALVGRFHRAVADLHYEYRFTRSGVHDTALHLAKLREQLGSDPEASDLARQILVAAGDLPAMPVLPRRHIHGDLKISNLLFRRYPIRGACLVDLDTLGRGTIAFELGDAMRSWCNPHAEDAGEIRFDLPIFAAAIGGFRAVADSLITREERVAIGVGLETVCIELAARFAIDVFEDRYFGWDASRFPTRRAHNFVRARGQLALGRDVRALRAEVMDVVLGNSSGR